MSNSLDILRVLVNLKSWGTEKNMIQIRKCLFIIMEKFRLEVFQLYIHLDWMLYKTLLLQIQFIAKPWSAKPLYIQISDGFFCNTSKSYHLIYPKLWLRFSVSYRMSKVVKPWNFTKTSQLPEDIEIALLVHLTCISALALVRFTHKHLITVFNHLVLYIIRK